MARPTLSPGALGTLTTAEYVNNPPAERWRARGRMRLLDYNRRNPETGAYATGRRVDITGFGPTQKAAEAACRRAARDRMIAERVRASTQQQVITEARRVDTVAESLLIAAGRSGELAASSIATYRIVLGHLRATDLASMDVARVRPTDVASALALVTAASAEKPGAAKAGTGAAKSTRALLNRVFGHAVAAGWLDASPVRDAGPIRTPKRRRTAGEDSEASRVPLDHERALTHPERVALAWSVARSERARRLDVRDLILAGMAVGGRIGEICALRWCDVTIVRGQNESGRAVLTGSVTLSATVDRLPGRGIVRHQPKTDTSIRTVPLPRRVVALLLRRARAARANVDDLSDDQRPVFPNPGRWGTGEGWRDRSNTAATLRREFDAAGLPWLSFHGLRRAAVTALADHLPIRAVADYAGHKSIRTTLDSYIGRGAVSDEVTKYL